MDETGADVADVYPGFALVVTAPVVAIFTKALRVGGAQRDPQAREQRGEHPMNVAHLAWPGLLVALLSACTLGPDFVAPAATAPAAWPALQQAADAAQGNPRNLNSPKCQFWLQQNRTAPTEKSQANVLEFCY